MSGYNPHLSFDFLSYFIKHVYSVKLGLFSKKSSNKNPAVLNIIESYFSHQTEVDIKAMGHACKTVIKTNIYFPSVTTSDCKKLA